MSIAIDFLSILLHRFFEILVDCYWFLIHILMIYFIDFLRFLVVIDFQWCLLSSSFHFLSISYWYLIDCYWFPVDCLLTSCRLLLIYCRFSVMSFIDFLWLLIDFLSNAIVFLSVAIDFLSITYWFPTDFLSMFSDAFYRSLVVSCRFRTDRISSSYCILIDFISMSYEHYHYHGHHHHHHHH